MRDDVRVLMTSPRRAFRWALGIFVATAVWPLTGSAFANVAVGDVLENGELPTLDGGKHAFLSK